MSAGQEANTQSKKTAYPRDTVVLHQPVKGPWAPTLGHFCVKLETYIRMAGIPYVIDTESGFSSKHKVPWISYNDEDIADSQFCIEYLNDKFHVDLNKHFFREQRAVVKAFQRLAEENLYWTHMYCRYVSHVEETRKAYGPSFPAKLITLDAAAELYKGMTLQQGVGRHSEKEVIQIAEVDMKAIADYLGDKDYMLWHEPCEEDCALFGQLAQFLWHAQGLPHSRMVHETFPNLRAYCMRIKERFWPDWDQCITHGNTKD